MSTCIRLATIHDIPSMVELSEHFRATLQEHQPRMWRKAESSRQAQTVYFENLLSGNPNILALVHEQSSQAINGFVIASLISAPPVYDPGGLTCMIDDFCVGLKGLWPSVGKALLQAVTHMAQAHGAVQVVAVAPHFDKAKRAMLRSAGLTIASEWYTRSL
jgi:ribosomal protein S18 acetylase RimI-like enzyme